MPLKQSVLCDAPMAAFKTCTKKTKHESGRCQHHRGVPKTSGGASDPAISADCAALANTDVMASVDPNAPILPLPEGGPPAGAPLGVPVFVADGQIEDSTIIAQRYLHPDDPSKTTDVIHMKLTPEGEELLRHAVGLDGQSTVTQTVTTMVDETGRHPLDLEEGLATKVDQVARSYNARLKKGETMDAIRAVNEPRLEELQAAIATVSGKVGADDVAGQQMLAHYQAQAEELGKRLALDTPLPYTGGGKVPMMAAWEGTFQKEVSHEVQVPVDPNLATSLLPCKEVAGSRIDPTLEGSKSYWKPGKTTKSGAPPKMWKVDLGDGYEALYYPEEHTKGQGYSMRRRLAVVAKNGDAQGALERLSKLHLSGSPATAAQAEFAYLERNAYALGLNDQPAVAQARATGAGYINTLHKSLVTQRAHQAAGMSEKERRDFVHDAYVEAQGKSLEARAKRLREAVAVTLGFASGDALRAHPTYQPIPRATGGGVYMNRFAAGPDETNDIGNVSFTHNVTGSSDNLVKMVQTGGFLASQERRRFIGTPKGIGMSEGSDVSSGGGSAVFLRISKGKVTKPSGSSGARLAWSGQQAQALAARTDWYATPGDHFGATNPNDHHFGSGFHRKLSWLRGRASGEFMPEGGVCLKTHPPTWISTTGPAQRQQIISQFKAQGVTHFSDGRAVEDVVV